MITKSKAHRTALRESKKLEKIEEGIFKIEENKVYLGNELIYATKNRDIRTCNKILEHKKASGIEMEKIGEALVCAAERGLTNICQSIIRHEKIKEIYNNHPLSFYTGLNIHKIKDRLKTDFTSNGENEEIYKFYLAKAITTAKNNKNYTTVFFLINSASRVKLGLSKTTRSLIRS